MLKNIRTTFEILLTMMILFIIAFIFLAGVVYIVNILFYGLWILVPIIGGV